MRFLIVYAHLHKDGYCGHVLKQVTNFLDSQKKKYDILDLYEMDYDPLVRAFTPDGAVQTNSEDRVLQKMIKNKHLIFIYPVWWGVMPAILKGFIDRTLTTDYAYYFEGNIPKGLLKNDAIVFQTMGGPRFLVRLVGNRPMKNIRNDILRFCGVKTKVYQFGSCRGVEQQKLNEITKTVKYALSKV